MSTLRDKLKLALQCILDGRTLAVLDVIAERRRQIDEEGFSPAGDDALDAGRLAMAAALYAAPSPLYRIELVAGGYRMADPWPMNSAFDKRTRHDRRRQLVIAGALIIAEIERFDRDHPVRP